MDTTYIYEYDEGGNITRKVNCYLAAQNATPIGLADYIYGYDNMTDKMIMLDQNVITYDDSGNPLNYTYGRTLSWTGTRLTGATKDSNTMSFTYNFNGIRIGKTVNGIETIYFVNGDKIIAEQTGDDYFLYLYDASGDPIGFRYSHISYAEDEFDYYWYEKNLHGDIVSVYDITRTKLVSYIYDAWGYTYVTYHNGASVNHVVANNPFRYRGYYYDADLNLYYLGSRYYDPITSRFISPDSFEYAGANGDLNSYNLYAYCGNDPVNRYDPNGYAWETILDVVSIGWSLYDLIKKPSWINVGWLALDVLFAIVPFLTGSNIIKAASKLDEVAYVGQGINRFDNLYDTVVLGNDMNRVMDRAWDIGATFYGGYGPLNALGALHDFNSATDAMRYAGKLDNARFIIDKFNDGYKFIHIGSDGRGFFAMMKSAYGMELKILYRLKIGNKLHKTWWLLNTGRRVVW